MTQSDPLNQLRLTSITQPLLVLSQVLRFKYLCGSNLAASDYLIGHSIG